MRLSGFRQDLCFTVLKFQFVTIGVGFVVGIDTGVGKRSCLIIGSNSWLSGSAIHCRRLPSESCYFLQFASIRSLRFAPGSIFRLTAAYQPWSNDLLPLKIRQIIDKMNKITVLWSAFPSLVVHTILLSVFLGWGPLNWTKTWRLGRLRKKFRGSYERIN